MAYSLYDAIVIGAGLTGCVIARRLADEMGYKVLIVEKREHVGGNLYDYVDDNGIVVQKYGPHVFHTDSDKIYQFLIKYCEWENYNLKCVVYMCSKNTPSPFNFKTIDDYYGEEESSVIKNEIIKEYGTQDKATIVELLGSDNRIIKEFADFLFEHDYSLYTAKQWGVSPWEIDVSVLNRVPILFSYKDSYFSDKYQILPVGGFTKFIKKLIGHDNIDVTLSSDFTERLKVDTVSKQIFYEDEKLSMPIVFTGELDRLLKYRFDRLPYRSLNFNTITVNENIRQPVPIIAYPEDERITRVVEYKQLPVQDIEGVTTLVEEYPVKYEGDNEPYYPILTSQSIAQYEKYKNAVAEIPNIYVCGRLGDFKYYNMDQAIKRAFEVFELIKVKSEI